MTPARPGGAPAPELFTREEVLGGLPARRAHALLYLIESRTAHQVARTRAALDLAVSEGGSGERDLAFLEAFALGRTPPLRPTIQDLERQAPIWAQLVPDSPRLRAAVAHLLGEKYRFTWQATPAIRAALGLDLDAVGRAHQRLYDRPIETIFEVRPTPAERLRWGWVAFGRRLEALPPFWAATLLTLTLGLSLSFLATPIAVAGVGPLAGVGLIAALGVVNMLTMACMAESVARSGSVRYGGASLVRMATDYLGGAGAALTLGANAGLFFLVLLASFIGMADTLGSFTPVPAAVWAALLLGGGLWVLARGSLNLSVNFQILLGCLNVVMVLVLSALTLGHVRVENLLASDLPFRPGSALDPSTVQLLGVILVLYFSQVLVIRVASLVLPRDPGAGALIWGSVAGTACSTALFCLWTAVVGGALGRDLAGHSGTAVTSLAAVLGPVGGVLGTLVVLTLLGQTALRTSALMFSLVRERLPARAQPILVLPRRRGQLVFEARRAADRGHRVGITYLGKAGGAPRFRLDVQNGDQAYQVEHEASESCDVGALLDGTAASAPGRARLVLQVLDAVEEHVRVRVDSTLAVTYRGEWVGAPAPAGAVLTPAAPRHAGHRIARWIGGRGRFLVSASPVLLVFVLTEWMLFAGVHSFSRVLGFAGVIAMALISGVLPVLLLRAGRRRGEVVPKTILAPLGHAVLIVAVYFLFLAIIFAHGFVIWQSPIERAGAVVCGVLILAATVVMIRQGAFVSRAVLDLREVGEDGGLRFAVVAGGRPVEVEVCPGDSNGGSRLLTGEELPALRSLGSLTVSLPPELASELKVWAHRRGPAGEVEGLAAFLDVEDDGKPRRWDLKLAGGQVLLPLRGGPTRLRLSPAEPTPADLPRA